MRARSVRLGRFLKAQLPCQFISLNFLLDKSETPRYDSQVKSGEMLSGNFRANQSGRVFCEDEVDLIAEVVSSCSGLSRWELAATVCELVGWRRANGGLKTRECRDLLERLHEQGLIRLPAKGKGRPKGVRTSVRLTDRGEAGEPIEGRLQDIAPLWLEAVSSKGDRALWRELLVRYHYLGHSVPFGAHLRYFVKTAQPQEAIVGCLQYSSPAWRMQAREDWIGWSDSARRRNLQRVLSQSRFLILPWVRVNHLASHVLALSIKRIALDWEERFGVQPVLVETLVDSSRFKGTCYRAANWLEVGETSGRGRMDRKHARHGAAPKRLFLYALTRNAREQLCDGGRPWTNPPPGNMNRQSSRSAVGGLLKLWMGWAAGGCCCSQAILFC